MINIHKIKILYKEKWKTLYINNLKTNYKYSNYGRLKNKNSNKILKPMISNKGYIRYRIYFMNKKININIHRIVCEGFNSKPLTNKLQVNHKDGNKQNNYYKNLEWCSQSENINHAHKHGLYDETKNSGEKCYLNKFPEELVIKICELLQKQYSTKMIRKKLNLEAKGYGDLIRKIRKRKTWKYISKKYKW